jgi:thiamine biosynthesis lipoprotein
MATKFEIALHGDDPVRLRAAAEEALDEIDRLEAQLSLYRPTSEISRLNAHAGEGPRKVEAGLFRLLERAHRHAMQTDGAFDITSGPLVRCWGFLGGTGHWPDPEAIEAARACVGMRFVELDPRGFAVELRRPGMILDLGAIGKGWAIDRAVEILKDAGVTSAFVHGGTSTVYAIGTPPDQPAWKVAIDAPQLGAPAPRAVATGSDPPPGVVALAELKDESLSVTAVWGKAIEVNGKRYGHVIDPRTGWPVSSSCLAAVVLPSATDTDALSTALLCLGPDGQDLLRRLYPDIRTLVASPLEGSSSVRISNRGFATC